MPPKAEPGARLRPPGSKRRRSTSRAQWRRYRSFHWRSDTVVHPIASVHLLSRSPLSNGALNNHTTSCAKFAATSPHRAQWSVLEYGLVEKWYAALDMLMGVVDRIEIASEKQDHPTNELVCPHAPPIRHDLGVILSAARARSMCKLKRFSLVAGTALVIFLLSPIGEARDTDFAASPPSSNVSLDQTGTTGLDFMTVEGRGTLLYASSHCCNQDNHTCCPPGNPLEETKIATSPDPQCFDLAELSAHDVSIPLGENQFQASEHCCNQHVKTCCAPVFEARESGIPLWSELQNSHIAGLKSIGATDAFSDDPLQESSHCCNENNYTCCPSVIPPEEVAILMLAESTRDESVLAVPDGFSTSDVIGPTDYSYCCNQDVRTCCPDMRGSLADLSSGASLAWLQGSYGISIEDLRNWSVAFVAPATFDEWLNPHNCCSEATGVYTCCPARVGDNSTDAFEAEMTVEKFRRLAALASGVVQVWLDGSKRARAVCLK